MSDDNIMAEEFERRAVHKRKINLSGLDHSQVHYYLTKSLLVDAWDFALSSIITYDKVDNKLINHLESLLLGYILLSKVCNESGIDDESSEEYKSRTTWFAGEVAMGEQWAYRTGQLQEILRQKSVFDSPNIDTPKSETSSRISALIAEIESKRQT